MKKPLTRKDVQQLERDPLEAMKNQAADARDVPIAEHGDAPNPPGTDPNGEPIDAVESSNRTAPLRSPRVKDPLARSGVMDESLEDVSRR